MIDGLVELPGFFADVIKIDDAIGIISSKYKLPNIRGSVGARGWTFYNVVQECARKYYYRYVEKTKIEIGTRFEIGILTHWFLALHYLKKMKSGWSGLTKFDSPLEIPDLFKLKLELLDTGARGDVIEESWRISEGYMDHYMRDYFTPLAIEHPQIIDNPRYSCRYDLIAHIDAKNDLFIPAGTYIVDYKTKARIDEAALSAWQHDGELKGQALIYRENKLENIFGPLKGIIVDIIGKQKNQKFHRCIIPIQNNLLDEFHSGLHYWSNQAEEYHKSNFKKREASCLGQYGKCDYYDMCW